MNSSVLDVLVGAQSVELPAISSSVAIPRGWHWQWSYVVYLFLTWQMAAVFWNFWWKAPSKIIIAAYPTPFGRLLTALRMLVDSETLVQDAYDSADGKSFAIPMTDRWIVFISDRDQVKQLENEPESKLSMEEALHELAFTESILGHHQVPPEHKGPKSESFRVTVGVLKNKLRSNIPTMSSAIQMRIKEAVALEVEPPTGKSEQGNGGWQKVRLMTALLRIFTRVNLLVMVGEDQADRLDVYNDIMGFFWSCANAFPIFTLIPGFLLPLIGPIVMGWGIARQRAYNLVLRLTRQSLDREGTNDEKPAQGHVTQWAAEMANLKDAAAIAKITLGLLFASAFQVPMIAQFCIYRFCQHPKYHEQLRAEASECRDMSFSSLNQEMPYLDSFIKETARLSPGPIRKPSTLYHPGDPSWYPTLTQYGPIKVSAPRKVMVPYTTSDGHHIPTGNWLAIPQLSLMRDESIWPHAKAFDGFRFVDEKSGASASRLTHPSYEFPFWGSIHHACPARFYVSVVMKMILSHLILDYEFKLADPTARPFLTFGKMRLPSPFQTILVRKREGKSDKMAR